MNMILWCSVIWENQGTNNAFKLVHLHNKNPNLLKNLLHTSFATGPSKNKCKVVSSVARQQSQMEGMLRPRERKVRSSGRKLCTKRHVKNDNFSGRIGFQNRESTRDILLCRNSAMLISPKKDQFVTETISFYQPDQVEKKNLLDSLYHMNWHPL